MGKWFLHPFGNYVGTLNIFQDHYQPRLTELYQRKPPNPLDFGIGYQSRFNQSNLLLAIKNSGAPDLTGQGLKDASPDHEFGGGETLKKRVLPVHLRSSENDGEIGIY
jgi:hypothetical protein